MSYIDLGPRSLRFNIFKLLFHKKHQTVWSQILYGASMGCWDENLSKCSGSRWLSCPFMVKSFKNLLLQNQEADDLETWYTWFGSQILPNLFKWWPCVDLDYFYDMVTNVSTWVKAFTGISKLVLIQHILSTQMSNHWSSGLIWLSATKYIPSWLSFNWIGHSWDIFNYYVFHAVTAESYYSVDL